MDILGSTAYVRVEVWSRFWWGSGLYNELFVWPEWRNTYLHYLPTRDKIWASPIILPWRKAKFKFSLPVFHDSIAVHVQLQFSTLHVGFYGPTLTNPIKSWEHLTAAFLRCCREVRELLSLLALERLAGLNWDRNTSRIIRSSTSSSSAKIARTTFIGGQIALNLEVNSWAMVV